MHGLRPMPTTPKAMNHFEKPTRKERGLLKPSHFLNPSHSLFRF